MASAAHDSDRSGPAPDFQLLIDSAPALIHTSLPDGYLDFFNQSWLEYVGRPLEDLQGWKWTAVIHPDDVEGIVEAWRASLASGKPFLYEARVRRADGEYRWMLHHKVAIRDEHGEIVKWHGSSIDIEDRKQAEEQVRRNAEELQRSEFYLAEGQRLGHMGSWAFDADGFYYWSPELFRMHGLDPAGKPPSIQQYLDHVHPQDRESMADLINGILTKGSPFDSTKRIVRPDGEVRHIRCVGASLVDNQGRKKCVGSAIDVTEHELLAQALHRREAYLAEAQRLSHTGSWAWDVRSSTLFWSDEIFRIYDYNPQKTVPSWSQFLERVHPEDRSQIEQRAKMEISGNDWADSHGDFRIVLPDGTVKHLHTVAHPARDGSGELTEIIGTVMDVTEHIRLTHELQRREAYLAEAQRLSHTGSFGWRVSSGEIFWSDETFRIFECDLTTKPTVEFVLSRVPLEDRDLVQHTIDRASQDGQGFDFEHRLQMPRGAIKHVHVTAHPTRDSSGNLEFVGAVTDVSEQRSAEAVIRRQEAELRQIVDLGPRLIAVYGPNRERLYANRTALNYLGISLDQWRHKSFGASAHPDDSERLKTYTDRALLSGAADELELRLRKADGSYRWFLARFTPLWDEQGRITRWYFTGTDIDDRKQAEDILRRENVALREEIDKASMFEEIVGTSPALQKVLSRISKVGPTDSTVLLIGETGTGKELIARAIHKRSQRSSRPFVGVNCAAVPRDLIASELFGHEKGAFTGALQRRLGRFELAQGGTIFLDEVGELPTETQVALLRVLQEREFERVGGNQLIRANVRVISATNRDLEVAIAAGSFRRDLFYRLSVFPIESPPLRERKSDIPMLVEYFIGRYARKAGKRIRNVEKSTMQLLCAYSWPGNIRELQNVIERSVILCDGDTIAVDSSWLSLESAQPHPISQPFGKKTAAQEKDMIEAALAKTGGRVSGPSGAAAALAIPASTLESKIRSLGINKFRFKHAGD